MFDELHDPHPPAAGPGDLATVAARARQLRWRRNALAGSAAAVVLLSGLGAVAVSWDGDSGDRIGSAEPPPGDSAGPESSPSTTLCLTVPTSTSVVSRARLVQTWQPPTTLDMWSSTTTVVDVNSGSPVTAATEHPCPSDPLPSGEPGDVTSTTIIAPEPVGPGSSPIDAATTTSIAGTTTTTTTTTTMTGQPAAPARVTAIDGDGDAVVLSLDGGEVTGRAVVFDGLDRDDPPPDEGGAAYVDSVVVAPDEAVIFVGVCCEPVPGSVVAIDGADPTTEPRHSMFAHAVAMSPSGTNLAGVSDDGIVAGSFINPSGHVIPFDDTVEITNGTFGTFIPFAEAAGARPVDVVWIDDSTLAVIGVDEDTGIAVYLVSTATGTVSAPQVLQVGLDDVTTFQFAGIDGLGRLAVLRTNALTESEIWRLDPQTLAQVAPPLPLPAPALSATYGSDGRLLWVGEDRRMRIDGEDVTADGEFLWASW